MRDCSDISPVAPYAATCVGSIYTKENAERGEQAMARISRLGRRDVSDAVGEIYDRYVRQRGNVPNMFRTVAHRPEILQTMIAHMEAVLNTGTLPTSLKELVIVRTSQMNGCEYCLASHSLLAKKLGYSDAQIA